MKIFKTFAITLFALLLTGCYTQLQYSQGMRKVTDEPQHETKGYSWNDDEEANNGAQIEQERAANPETQAESAVEPEDSVPVYYKDYAYAEKYKDCYCSPHNVYNFYGDSWGYDTFHPYYPFGTYLSVNPFYFDRWNWWHYRRFHPYYRSSFAFSFSWGNPFYYNGFYNDPFFDPYYDYYWYSGYHPFAYTYWRFYGNFGHGIYYHGDKGKADNRRYAPRSIGTNRVANSNNRSRDEARVSGRTATQSSGQTVRIRSVGTSRTKATVTRSRSNSGTQSKSTVTRSRSRGSSSKSSGTTRSRSRSRDNFQSDSRSRVYIDRSDQREPVIIDADRYRELRLRAQNEQNIRRINDRSDLRSRLQKAPDIELRNRVQHSQPTFLQRMKTFFDTHTVRVSNDGTNRSSRIIRSRSSSGRSNPHVSRSNGNSSRSSVTRSRSSSSSSSSHARSRGHSSSSRSRSGGDNSSGSSRSRGN